MTTLRRAVAQHLEAELGWRESRLLFELYPAAGSRLEANRTFALGLPETTAAPGRMRQHLAVTSTVDVRFAWVIKSDAQRSSYEAALDAEGQLIAALATFRSRPDIVRVTRALVADGTFFLGTVRATVPHSIPIA